MKTIVWVLLIISVLYVSVSCRKTVSTSNAETGLVGRWNIILDSFGTGVGYTAHVVGYRGGATDYYNFNSNGNLYVKEGTNSYTYAYQVTSGSAVILSIPSGDSAIDPVSYSITNLTDHSVTLINPWLITPGGTIGRVVYLQR